MKNILIDFFRNNNLDYQNKTIVLAVSTGVDSSVMLDLFIKYASVYQVKLVVAHCNHNKRAQSLLEKDYIKNFCIEKNILCYTEDFDFQYLKDNFQAVAREKRYEFFDKVMQKVNGDYLVLAHHADDLLETILFRFLRGSSLLGYAGIRPVNIKMIKCDNNEKIYYVIRPLLTVSKDSIYEYAKQNNTKYFEDESNETNHYARNRLRHEVIPIIKEEYTDVLNKALEFSKTIQEASYICNTIRDDFIHNFVIKRNNKIEFKKNIFLKLSQYMQEEVLFELVKKDSLSKSNISELLKIIRGSKVNFKLFFKESFDFIIEYDNIIISYNNNDSELVSNINIKLTGIGDYIISDKININVSEKTYNNITNLNELWYNINNFPITIRSRQPGDKIKLKSGYKKVKDILIDLKIKKSERDKLLLACKDDEVLIIFGVRKSEVLKEETFTESNILIKLEEK